MVEGLACALGAALGAGPGFVRLIDEAVPGRGLTGVIRLVLSLTALFTVASCGARLRARAPETVWSTGRTAQTITAAIALGACASCAVARWDLVWVVPCGLGMLVASILAIVLSPGRRGRRATIAGAWLAALVLLPCTCWPLRLTVWLWRDSLDELAVRVERGGGSSQPEWAGPFMFVKTRSDYKGAFLVTGYRPSGDIGLAWGSANRSVVNAFYEVPAGSGWWFVFED